MLFAIENRVVVMMQTMGMEKFDLLRDEYFNPFYIIIYSSFVRVCVCLSRVLFAI